MTIINLAAYKFATLTQTELTDLREACITLTNNHALKGTILLSEEGINIMIAGTSSATDAFKAFIQQYSHFSDITFKISFSDTIPFKRMKVKIKKETITFRKPTITPEKSTAPYITPHALREWYQSQKNMLVIDTRNDYETAVGKFINATDLDLKTFTEFPEKSLAFLKDVARDTVIVTYCTGGIRCEKAATYLLTEGFQEVYQLEGGILNYFNECGQAFYDGKCFVFDERVAI